MYVGFTEAILARDGAAPLELALALGDTLL